MTTPILKALFPQPGGKQRQARWVAGIIDATPHECFVDVLCGAGSMYWAKSPGAMDVINDAERCVVASYRGVRDHPDLVVKEMSRMPYSRDLYKQARYHIGSSTKPGSVNPDKLYEWELGVWYLYAACFTVSGNVWDSQGHPPDRIKQAAWARKPAKILPASERLQGTRILNWDALRLVRRCDHEDYLLFVDPPYVGDEHYYRPSKKGFDHAGLAAALRASSSKVIVNHYLGGPYPGLYEGWRVVTKGSTQSCVGNTKTSRAGGQTRVTEALFLTW